VDIDAFKLAIRALEDGVKRKRECKKVAGKRDWNYLMHHYRD
jgi:hypothetical protein